MVFTDSSGEVISYYPSVVRYQVVDDQGRVVEGEFNASYNAGTFPELPFGTYTVKKSPCLITIMIGEQN